MASAIEDVIRRCTDPLREDWTLQQEVAQELRSHLEEKCAELEHQGLSPEECELRAVRCFGEPDEIGTGLFRANFHRLRRWAKVRFAIRILTVPALLAALLLVVNFDVIGGVERLQELRLFDAIPLPEFLFDAAGWWNAVPEPCAGESSSEDFPGVAGRIGVGGLQEDFRPEFFDAAIRREPENALYRYEKAAALVREAVPGIVSSDFGRSAVTLAFISDEARQKLEHAAELYRSALPCSRCTDYAAVRNRRDNQRRYPNENFHSLVGRLADATLFPLPQLAAYRQLGRWMPVYVALLIREGREHEARTLLDSWKTFTVHQLQDCDTVVGVLTLQGILERWQEKLPPLYAALGEVKKGGIVADEIARITAPVRRWRKEAGNSPASPNEGILSVFCAWNPQEIADATQLSADRRITYALCDQLVLLYFGGIGLGISLLFVLIRLAEWLCGRREEWLRLSGGQVGRLFCFGILLPLVLCWMLTHVELFSGRDTAVFRNPLVWLQWGCFLIGLPGWFMVYLRRLLKERARSLLPEPEVRRRFRFFPCGWCVSILPVWIFFLLISAAFARWSVGRDLACGVAEERRIFSGFPTAMEERWSSRMTRTMLQILSETGGD